MTATQKAETGNSRKKLPAMVAVLAILLMLLGGGYMLWVAWTGNTRIGGGGVVGADDPPSGHPQWEAMRIARQAEIQAARFNRPDGFEKAQPNGDPLLKAGEYEMVFRKRQNGDLRATLRPMRMEEFITADQAQVLNMRCRVQTDKAVQAYLKVTPEQLAALNKVSNGNGGMVMDPPDETKVGELYKTYQSSAGQARSDAEKSLVALVKDIAARSVGPTKKSVVDRVAAIEGIISKDQVEAFKKM